MIGQTISPYKIAAKLGEGAMAVVYKGENLKLKRTGVYVAGAPQNLTCTKIRAQGLRA